MLLIGIDQSDAYHDVAAINESTGETTTLHIANDEKGFASLDALIDRLAFSSRPAEVMVALETPKGLLFSHLLEKGYVVYPINPKAVVRYRDRHHPSGAKSDTIDALVLAHILRTDRENHRPILPDGEVARELKIVARDRNSLVTQRGRLLNQLTAALKEYYPAALFLFKDLSCPLALAFLQEYPIPGLAEKATVADLEQLLQRQHAYRKGKAEELNGLLRIPRSRAPRELERAKSRYVRALVSQLQALKEAIDEYEAEISRLLILHPAGIIFQELPGAGVVLAGGMLGEIGDCKEKYPDKESLQAMAGTVPITRQSGKVIGVRFRRGCQKPLRNVMQQFAFTSLCKSQWAKEYYQEQKAKGHKKNRALRALANRWLAIIWKLWHDGLHYDEAHHQKQRQLHGQKNAVAA